MSQRSDMEALVVRAWDEGLKAGVDKFMEYVSIGDGPYEGWIDHNAYYFARAVPNPYRPVPERRKSGIDRSARTISPRTNGQAS